MLLNFDMPIDAIHGAIGLTVNVADQLGAEKNINIRVAYAYRAISWTR